jgi:hypothetical protein
MTAVGLEANPVSISRDELGVITQPPAWRRLSLGCRHFERELLEQGLPRAESTAVSVLDPRNILARDAIFPRYV